MTTKQFGLVVALVLTAFAAGWLANGAGAVHAQSDAVQLEVRQVGPNASMVMYYPAQKRAYVYANPFIGGPKQGCAYWFQLGEPGGVIRREQCKVPDEM